jgi:hypothetical protein
MVLDARPAARTHQPVGRRTPARWLAATLAVLLALAFGLWLRSTTPSERVPLPPVGASPEQVVRTHLDAVHVPVTFHTTHAPDISIPDDEGMFWGYILVRNKDTDPWRIIDRGVG